MLGEETLLNRLDALGDLARERIAAYEAIKEEINSQEPGSLGMRIVAEVASSREVYTFALNLIAVNQLWENQIDKNGVKLPLYKPSTLRKKPVGWTKMNYTYFHTGKFYNNGILLSADPYNVTFSFDKAEWPTDAGSQPYFLYIPDSVVGMTESNFSLLQDFIQEMVIDRKLEYLREKRAEYGIGGYF